MNCPLLQPKAFVNLILGIATCVVAAFSGQAAAISIRHDVPEADYFNLAAQFPAVGRIDDEFGALCSGTLVAPDKVLTAAHCVDGLNASINNVPDITISATTFILGNDVGNPDSVHDVIAVAVNRWNGLGEFDMAMLTLAAPVTGVVPSTVSDVDSAGQVATMVGFGGNGVGINFADDFDDLKRAAQNVVSTTAPTVRSDFDHPNGSTNTFGSSTPLALEGTTAGGDSGGPLYINHGGSPTITGVLHGGFNDFGRDSEYGDISIWASVANSRNRDFLIAQGITIGGPDVTADFNSDGNYDCTDIDSLNAEVAAGSNSAEFDLDGDGLVNDSDVNQWLSDAGSANLGQGISYRMGDSNLDGFVDASDFNVWNENKFTQASAWCSGDFNSDGFVDGSDFNVWNQNKFTNSAIRRSARMPASFAHSSTREFQAVPEPGGALLLLLGAVGFVRRK